MHVRGCPKCPQFWTPGYHKIDESEEHHDDTPFEADILVNVYCTAAGVRIVFK